MENPKTGKTLISASKLDTKADGEEHKLKNIDIPSENIHETIADDVYASCTIARLFVSKILKFCGCFPPLQGITAPEVAQYIFDTGDIDGVKAGLAGLVQQKKVSGLPYNVSS